MQLVSSISLRAEKQKYCAYAWVKNYIFLLSHFGKLMERCFWAYRSAGTLGTLFDRKLTEELEMKQRILVVGLLVGLVGCASQAIDQMNSGLGHAMGEHISGLEKALGTPAEIVREGNQTRYRWFKENHIQPCNVEVWADGEGLVRKTSWSGYQGACEQFAVGLSDGFPRK
tara:strand:+ start:15 stop:527 length:513 start_codon:yes stop_codon:yes gene_type:complete